MTRFILFFVSIAIFCCQSVASKKALRNREEEQMWFAVSDPSQLQFRTTSEHPPMEDHLSLEEVFGDDVFSEVELLAPPDKVDAEEHQRDLQSDTDITVINNCGDGPLTLAVIYENAQGTSYTFKRWYSLSSSTSTTFRNIAGDFYTYAYTPGFGTFWRDEQGNSPYCFSGSYGCFHKVNYDNSGSETTHSMPCGGYGANSQTAPPPTPSPTPAPVSSSSGGGASNEWVTAHNTHRQRIHSEYGVSSTDLTWSNTLANSAKNYAELLSQDFSSCHIEHNYQDSNYQFGENLAANWGYGTGTRAATPEEVLNRWVEEEESNVYPANGHLTQVVWKKTAYVGCGEASKTLSNGWECFIQVCRYVRPGNCGTYSDMVANWESKMISDDSPCGPFSP